MSLAAAPRTVVLLACPPSPVTPPATVVGRRLLGGVLALSLWTLPGQVGAQTIEDFTIGSFIGEQLGNIASSMRGASESKGLATEEIRTARRRFWAAYPDKPGFAEAEAEFARRLLSKDLYYLNVAIANKNQAAAGRGDESLIGMIDRASGAIDGGIRQDAADAFQEWVNAVWEVAPERFFGARVVTQEAITRPKSIEAYQAYLTIRDRGEFNARNHANQSDTANWYADPMFYFPVALQDHSTGASIDRANREFRAALRMLDMEVENVHNGYLAKRREIPAISPRDYLKELAQETIRTTQNNQQFLELTLALNGNSSAPGWLSGGSRYFDLVRRYGEAAVLSFAEGARTEVPAFDCRGSAEYQKCVEQILAQLQ